MSEYVKLDDAMNLFGRNGEYHADTIADMLSDLPTIEVVDDAISLKDIETTLHEWLADKKMAAFATKVLRLEAPRCIPQPKEGEWINKQEKYQMAECSNCKKVTMHEMWGDKLVYYDYCPNCGAKMKGADDDED